MMKILWTLICVLFSICMIYSIWLAKKVNCCFLGHDLYYLGGRWSNIFNIYICKYQCKRCGKKIETHYD